MSILKIENLNKKYGKNEVLKDINLEIKTPDIYALIGPNGSGKTTLFNTISNLINQDSGTIEVVDKDNQDPSIFYQVSFLKDNRVLYDYLTGYDHLLFIRMAQNLPVDRLDYVIGKLGIRDYINNDVGSYSLGMKQHLLIAMSIMNNPKLLILDEPLNGLDPSSIIKVRNIFKELHKNGTTILISSHTLSEIDKITNNVIFLKDGKIVEETMDLLKDNVYEIYCDEESLLRIQSLDSLSEIIIEKSKESITINMKEKKLFDLIEILNKNKLAYTDIVKRTIGAEQRYMEIFK